MHLSPTSKLGYLSFNITKKTENSRYWPLDNICAYVHTGEQPAKWL